VTASPRSVVHARPPRGAVGRIRGGDRAEDLEGFLEDAAHYPGGHARGIWFPSNEAEVATVVRGASRLLVIGAQSSLTGGATPFGDVLLSTARLDAITAWTRTSVVVQPGVVLSTLLAEVAARGLYYPPAPTYDGATVGGTVATNAAGAATFKYGTTRRWIEALTVVLANGDVLDLHRGECIADADGTFTIVTTDGTTHRLELPSYRLPDVPKVSSGYHVAPGMDLMDLFIGSEGTLGIVTSIELRLLAHPVAWFVGFVPVRDDDGVLRLVEALRTESQRTWADADPKGIDVAAIEYMDHRCIELLREDKADERVGVTLPPDTGTGVLFQAELDPATTTDAAYEELARAGDPTLDTALVRLCRVLQRHGVLEATIPALPGELARRQALFALREAVPAAVNRRIGEAQRTIDPTISKSGGDVIVPFPRLREALGRYRATLDRLGLDYAIWGHISDGNLHPNVLPRSSEEMRRAREAQLEIGTIAIELGGCPMSEHGTGRNAVKQLLLERLYGSAGLAAMRRVKRVLDPAGILAPGVMLPDPSSA
jgi:D-lactate dehydrogenase (cytochrome)